MNVVDGGGSRERERDTGWIWERDVTRVANWPGAEEVLRGGLSSEIKIKPYEEEQVWEHNIESVFHLFCVRTSMWN